MDGSTSPARSDASPSLRFLDQLKTLSCFFFFIHYFSSPYPFSDNPKKWGGACHVQGSQVDYTNEVATFPWFRQAGATLDRDLLRVTTQPSLGKILGYSEAQNFLWFGSTSIIQQNLNVIQAPGVNVSGAITFT
jgi:hypothetical protein